MTDLYQLLYYVLCVVLLGSCGIASLSDRHASTSLTSKDALGVFTIGKAEAVPPLLFHELFLEKAVVAREREGILKD